MEAAAWRVIGVTLGLRGQGRDLSVWRGLDHQASIRLRKLCASRAQGNLDVVQKLRSSYHHMGI